MTFFGRLSDIVEQWVHKGDRLYVEGRIEYSQTQDDQGGTRYWTEVRPVWPLLESLAAGYGYRDLILLTDDEGEAVEAIRAYERDV